VNGYSAAICLLAVACIESFVMRLRFLRKAPQKDLDRTPVTTYLTSIYPDFPYENELIEAFILRDIVTHNHLWHLGIDWDDSGMVLKSARKLSSGDKKYAAHVDVPSRKTKTLGLSVNPIRVGKSEVDKILKLMWKTFIFLEKKDFNNCSMSTQHYAYKGEMVCFGEVVGMPETCN
jgi:hypothetical protein